MTVYKIPSPSNSANELLLTAAAEARLRTMSRQADRLLWYITDANSVTSNLLRGEAVRLWSACFEITRLLGVGDVAGACRVRVGESDQSDGVVGAVA